MADMRRHLLASIERHPWWWSLALLAPLVLFPQIDIGVSRLFFDPIHNVFAFRTHPLGEFVRKGLPIGLFGLAGLVVVLWAAGEVRRRPLLGVTRRIAAFVVLSLVIGPGLIVNFVFKDHWGRPRPSTIAEFNGPLHYAPPGLPTAQCPSNCSFPSGHAALGFWTVAFALLVPRRHRRPAMAAALAFGALVGLVRIAQGGHFLSDVAFSGVIVTAITYCLHKWLVAPGEAPPYKNNGGLSEESS
jgi:lipid A 4'-phosphatase